MYKYYSCTGECPHTDTEQTIRVNYKHTPIMNKTRKSYKRISCDCAYSDECSYYKATKCPIYLDAPISK